MTRITTSLSPLDIAEILQAIVSMLDPKSQLAAILVSCRWYNCCVPILWNTISSTDWSLSRFSPRQLYGHAHLVRSLEWHSVHPNLQPLYPQYDQLFNDVDNKILSISSFGGHSDVTAKTLTTDDTVPEQLSLLCLSKIVGHCVNLQNLCLRAERDGIHVDTMQAIQSLTFLQSLELYTNRVVTDQETMKSKVLLLNVQELVKELPQLRRLVVRGTAFCFQAPEESPQGQLDLGENMDQEASQLNIVEAVSCACVTNERTDLILSPQCINTPSLPIQQLSLDTAVSEGELTLLLQQCPLLESLDLPAGLAWEWSDDFIKDFAESCPRLQAFSINASYHLAISDERLSALIRGLPPMRRFGARACQIGDFTLAALEERCPDLQKLDISLAKGHRITKAILYKYLKRAKSLEHLEAEAVWISLQDLQVSDAQDQGDELVENSGGGAGFHHLQEAEVSSTTSNNTATDLSVGATTCSEWASREILQHLAIGFTSPDRSTRLCKEMYGLLATLTRLEHLQLSYTCLDLSPSSGFHQLSSLKDLKILSIETCGYSTLTQEDLVWMVTAWPKLERIYVNMPGASKERQFRAWLKEAKREDVVIESQQSMVHF
ncbi:hypothetical protein BGX21_002198 [Mortierella sp. AD011]|nr:hypothetical protein BGX20_004829 [Mortierella sp. AD010]KAF9381042.1 hypothetical protein BGX21_002198 [Mortierella sp. AD011]